MANPAKYSRTFRLIFGLIFIAMLGLGFRVEAQELNCNVIIKSEGVEGIDRRVIGDMKKSVQEFLNLRRWTQDNFTAEERINCNLVINITSTSSTTKYIATAQIQSARPVYGTGYETVILNYLDKDWTFDYVEGQPMDFNDNNFSSTLTSLLAYYAYIIIGFDYDSFGKYSGRPAFLKAQLVANNAANSGGKGWSTFDGMNARINLLENVMNQQLGPFRDGFYSYHRVGLDNFATKPEQARAITLDFLKKIQTVLQNKPLCLLINSFMDAKATEIINIMMEGSYGDKQSAYSILASIDPTKTEMFQKLTK